MNQETKIGRSGVFVIRSLSGYFASQDTLLADIPCADELGPDVLESSRADIGRICRLMARDPLKLAEPSPKTYATLCGFMQQVTGYQPMPDRIVVLSVGGMIEDQTRYPRDSQTGLLIASAQRNFAAYVSGYVVQSMADMLIGHLDAELLSRLGRPAFRELGEIARANLAAMTADRSLPHLHALGDTLYRPFRECIRLQTGFMAAGDKGMMAKVAPLSALYCRGNYPLGMVRGGKLLVLVA